MMITLKRRKIKMKENANGIMLNQIYTVCCCEVVRLLCPFSWVTPTSMFLYCVLKSVSFSQPKFL